MDPAMSPLSILQNSIVTQPQIDEWLSSPRDIHARLVHFSTSPLSAPPEGPAPGSPSPTICTHSLRSNPSSMARACLHQNSTASTQAPSLYHYSEATPTETSVSTGLASNFTGVPLLEEVNGVLERRPNAYRPPLFECSFWFLSCPYITDSQTEWRTHCLSHFRGEEPPKSVQCPLCEDFKYTSEDGWASWSLRMDHIANHHLLGQTLRTSRPDFHLFHYLWQKRLIDDQDLKELKGGNHNLNRPPSNFTVTNGRRGEGRGQRHQHVGVRGPYRRPS